MAQIGLELFVKLSVSFRQFRNVEYKTSYGQLVAGKLQREMTVSGKENCRWGPETGTASGIQRFEHYHNRRYSVPAVHYDDRTTKRTRKSPTRTLFFCENYAMVIKGRNKRDHGDVKWRTSRDHDLKVGQNNDFKTLGGLHFQGEFHETSPAGEKQI